jgi:Ca-activated chloride channel family protein
MKISRSATDRMGFVALCLTLSATQLFPVGSSSDSPASSIRTPGLPQTPPNSSPAIPQQPSDATQSGDVRKVYVAVAGRDGTPTENLRLEDFLVTENGEPQQILGVSSAAATPLVLGILVDWSLSARNKPLVRDELELLWQFLKAAITKSDKALVVAFDDVPRRVCGITNDLSKLHAGMAEISNASPRGSTALYDSLAEVSSDIAKDSNARKIVVVLSDFEDNTSRSSLADTLPRVIETRVTVFTLFESHEPGSRKAETNGWRTARLIAKESGGFAYSVKASANLAAALNQLLVALRSSYLVEYRAAGRANKHKVVPLKVEVRRAGTSVFAPEYRGPAAP